MSDFDQIMEIKNDPTKSKYDKEQELSTIASYTDEPAALDALSKIRGGEIKMAVAENEDCPENLMRKLAKDRSGEVRKAVARNPSAPHDVLRELAGDNNDVKSWLAMNTNLPEDIATILSYEKFKDTLYHLLDNPKCPQSVHDRLGSIDKYKGRAYWGGYYTGPHYIR